MHRNTAAARQEVTTAASREVSMEQPIVSVSTVSDGLIVAFRDGYQGYFSAEFLLEHLGCGSNQMFLDYDPSPAKDTTASNMLTVISQ
jgi:hypothetical protein